MRESKVELSIDDLQELSKRLERFAEELPEQQATMLRAMVVLAGQSIGSRETKNVNFDRSPEKVQGLQAGFAKSFQRFAPDAFPEPDIDLRQLGDLTVCIEH